MYSFRVLVLSLCALVVGGAVAACSSTSDNPGGTDGGGVADGGSSDAGGTLDGGEADAGTEQHALPPAPGAKNAPDGTGTTTFAVSKIYFGDTDRDGTANKNEGWKQYGFDIDGKISTGSGTGLCKPRDNASPTTVHVDGDDGIDNSFGKNILPIFLGIQSDFSAQNNDAIHSGKHTYLFAMEKLGAGKNYNPMLTRFYLGSDLGDAPRFDGADSWPVVPELLKDTNDILSAKVQLPASYVTNKTWVSGPADATIQVSFQFANYTITLPISHAVVSMDLDEAHKSATNGTISGVISTQALVDEFKKVAGALDTSLCTGPTIDSISAQMRQASDILQDGSQDPTLPCDGISIGLGFDASIVQLGSVGPATVPLADPCAP